MGLPGYTGAKNIQPMRQRLCAVRVQAMPAIRSIASMTASTARPSSTPRKFRFTPSCAPSIGRTKSRPMIDQHAMTLRPGERHGEARRQQAHSNTAANEGRQRARHLDGASG